MANCGRKKFLPFSPGKGVFWTFLWIAESNGRTVLCMCQALFSASIKVKANIEIHLHLSLLEISAIETQVMFCGIQAAHHVVSVLHPSVFNLEIMESGSNVPRDILNWVISKMVWVKLL